MQIMCSKVTKISVIERLDFKEIAN